MQRVYFNWPIYVITIPIATMESGGGTAMAEGVEFEPTDPCGSPVFQTGALNQAMRPLHIVISGGGTGIRTQTTLNTQESLAGS